MKRVVTVLFAILLVLAVAGCQSQDPTTTPPPEATAPPATTAPADDTAGEEDGDVAAQAMTQADLVDILWQWTNFRNTAEVNDITVPNPAGYTLVFLRDGTLNIQADCNVVVGTYTIDGSNITIQQGASTAAFCGEESLDQTFLAFLSQAAGFVSDGAGNLVLNLTADPGEMLFANGGEAPIPTEPLNQLTELIWQWTEFQDSAALNDIIVPNPANYTIIFREDGTLNIQADCNVVQGAYTADGGGMSITLGTSTLAFCGEESLDTQFLSRLNDVATYVFDETGNLVLNLIADAGNMVFTNGGAAPPVTE